jgi:hypothetical protein
MGSRSKVPDKSFYPFRFLSVLASNLLSDVAVRNAKAGEKLKPLRDGDGLYLIIHPNGSKYLQFRTCK